MRIRGAAALLATLCLATFVAVATALAAGELDPTFSSDGRFTEPLGEGPRPGGVFSAIALQPDGRILATGTASGNASVVARISPDGTLDPTFDSDGKLLYPLGAGADEAMMPQALAVAPDGKIVVAGTFVNFTTGVTQAAVVRLTPAGAFDDTFDGDGKLIEQLGEGANPRTNVFGVAVLPDGRILFSGSATDSAGRAAVLLVRRKPDGGPDPSFGSGGKQLIQLGTGTSASSGAIAMRLQPDGRVVIAGPATDTNAAQADAAVVARFDADGQGLDPSFGTGGRYLGRFGTPNHQVSVSGLALQPDGKPVVVGDAHEIAGTTPPSQALVARLRADGMDVDSAFGTSGSFMQTFEGANGDARLGGVVIQPDGKIVAVGSGEDQGFTVLVLRLTAAGALDPSFSGDGRDLTQLGQLSSGFSAAALQPDGKILAAGSTLNDVNGNLDRHPLVARYIADLPPAASFTVTPNPVERGGAVNFDGSASADPEGTALTHQWDFGDGATGTGATTSHSYAAPGAYAVKLTATDGYGLASSTTHTVTVNAPPGQASTGPVLSGLKMTPARFPAARRGGSIARRTGAKVSYTDSLAATTTFTVARIAQGRKSGKRCVKPTRRNRGAKRCNRFVRVRGSFSRLDRAGKNSFRFTGRVRRRALKPGRYRLSAKPKLGKTAGKTRTVRFRVVR